MSSANSYEILDSDLNAERIHCAHQSCGLCPLHLRVI